MVCLPAFAILLLSFPADAQTTQRTPQEGMLCAAAALALQDMSTIAEEKALFRQQADSFVQPFADAVDGNKAAEDRLIAEFTQTLEQYRSKINTLGPDKYMVAAYHEYTGCGGKPFVDKNGQ